MTYSIKYKELFHIKILHRYFLNSGSGDFDSMNPENQKKQLANYNYQSFLSVQPTIKTLHKLNGHRMSVFHTGVGFSIWAEVTTDDNQKLLIDPDDNFMLTFLIRINDYRFMNYTNLLLENEGRIYYFSNNVLPGESDSFPLITKPGGGFVDDSFILTEVGSANELNNFSAGEKNNLWGIIRIWMKSGDNDYHITDNQGKIPVNIQTFELNFENRFTIWRYIFDSDKNVEPSDDVKIENGDAKILVSKIPQPLTQNGFVSVELNGSELPNPNVSVIKPEWGSNKIFSEIYL